MLQIFCVWKIWREWNKPFLIKFPKNPKVYKLQHTADSKACHIWKKGRNKNVEIANKKLSKTHQPKMSKMRYDNKCESKSDEITSLINERRIIPKELKFTTTKPELTSIPIKDNQMPLKELNPTNFENKSLISKPKKNTRNPNTK